MAITNRGELVTAITVWIGRDGDTIVPAQADDIVTLAETGIIYGMDDPFESPAVRLRFMETVNDTFTIDGEFNDLPTDFLEAREVVLETSPRAQLQMVSPQHIDETWAGSQTDQPEVFTIQGNRLRVAPAPSGSFTATLTYWALARLDAADPTSTNTLLTTAPNVYLYACCMQGAILLGDIPDAQRWFAAYRSSVGGVQRSDDRGKWSGGTPAMRVMGPTP